MTDALKQILTGLGGNVEAMEADGLTNDDYKKIIVAKGGNVKAMEADGIFGDTQAPAQIEQPKSEVSKPFGFVAAIKDPEYKALENPFGDRDPIDNQPKETVHTDGTISTLTTGQPEDKQEAFNKFVIHPLQEDIAQASYGARRSITLPLAKMLDDGLNSLGIETDHIPAKDLAKANELIKAYNNKHPDQLIHPATVGSLASQILVPMAKSTKVVVATEAFLNALDGIGKRNDYEHVGRDATVGAVLGGTSMWLLNKVSDRLGAVSYGTKLLLRKHPDLNPDEVAKVLKGVPKEDQANVLANWVQHGDYADFVGSAVKNNADKLLLKTEARKRNRALTDIVGDVEKQVDEAGTAYGDIANVLAADKHNTHDFSNIANSLDSLVKRYDGNMKATSIVNNMKADLEAGKGFMDVRTALEFRHDINYLLNRARRYKEKASLSLIKKEINHFLEKNLDTKAFKQLETATDNYRIAMNNQDFMELMNKHTREEITDWVGFKEALKKEKLSSPQVDDAIDIVKVFSDKFKIDKQIRGFTKVKGQKENAMGALGVRSWLLQHLLDPLDTLFVGSTRHRELVIQGEILKSIRKAKDPKAIIDEILKSKALSKAEAESAVKIVEPLALPYKPKAATSATTADGEVRTLYATEHGTVAEKPNTTAAVEHFNELASNQPQALPAPSAPREAETTVLPSGNTKFVSPEGRVSTEKELANPPAFVAYTNTIDVHNIMNTVTENQRYLGVRLRLRLADAKTAKYGKGLSNEQLNLDREKSVNAIKLIVEKSQREVLSRRDRETLIKGLARTRQIDRELDIRGYDESYITNTERDRPSQLGRPNRRYRIRSGANQNTPRQTGATITPSKSTTGNSIVPSAEELEPIFKRIGATHGINIQSLRNSTDGHMRIKIEGAGTVIFYRRRAHLAFSTTNFNSGSSMGGKFYRTVFDVSRKLNIPYKNDNGLSRVNTVRLPINIYKYKKDTGYNVLQDSQRLHSLASNAIARIDDFLRKRGYRGIARLSDDEIKKFGADLGARSGWRLGPNSLKLYREMAKILASGGTLSLALLAPFIDAAYQEVETK